jgi:hypothetical protein
VAPDLANANSTTGTFKPTQDTKPVQVDPENTGKTVRIRASLTDN